MESVAKLSLPNPVCKASFISRQTYWWLNKLFKKGNDRRLGFEDFYEVPTEESSKYLSDKFHRLWEEELKWSDKHSRKPRLGWTLIKLVGLPFVATGIMALLEEIMNTAQPMFLLLLLSYFSVDSEVTKFQAYMYAMGLSLSAIGKACCHHPYFLWVHRIGMRIRVAVTSAVYKKALRLSQLSSHEATLGQVINLLSNDVQRYELAALFPHYLWIAPLQLVVISVLLWHEVGASCLVGLLFLLLFIPLQGWFGKLFASFRRNIAVLTDERCKLMGEIISGIRVIKLHTWEEAFRNIVEKIRKKETKKVQHVANLRSLNLAFAFTSPCIITFTSFTTFVLTGNVLTAAKVFSFIGFLTILRHSVGQNLPMAFQFLAEARVSTKRIQAFLEIEEMKDVLAVPKEKGHSVTAKSVSSSWSSQDSIFTLDSVSFQVSEGEMLIVVGGVGSGKSMLLLSLLGELPLLEGSVELTGKVAYVPQQPWIFNSTLKQNILFGREFDSTKYDTVLKVCRLEKDIDLLPEGDGTMVGDEGVQLSGGQKARIGLARAVYTDADIYLLDDPLSAVDSAVGERIFKDCFQGLLASRPKILVTHQLQYLTKATQILCLDQGKVLAVGTYRELTQLGIDLQSVIGQHIHTPLERTKSTATINGFLPSKEDESFVSVKMSDACKRRSLSSQTDITRSRQSLSVSEDFLEVGDITVAEEEERPRGGVSRKVYQDFFTAGVHRVVIIIMLVFFILAQGSFVLADWWLAYWIDTQDSLALKSRQSSNSTALDDGTPDTQWFVLIYAALVLGTFLLAVLRTMLFFYATITSSKKLHNRMLSTLLRAPVYFFDTNPAGRILNRFSKDIGQMDEHLPSTFFDFAKSAVLCLSVVIVNIVSMPYTLVGVVPLGIGFLFLRHYYLKTSREIKRLEAISRSPMYSQVTATLHGLPVIRSCGQEETVKECFHRCVDHHSEAWFLFIVTSRWLAVRLDIICILFVIMATFTPVLITEQENMKGGLAGLSITYAILLTTLFQWCVRQSAEVENQMTSVERVLMYCDLATEAEWENPSLALPPGWPTYGIITAESVSFQYHPSLPRVLKNMYFCVRAKEKIGVVGRTGAGKSTLISALTRLAEVKGAIRIDGVCTSDMGLHQLRRLFGIIPQDPVLFSGSLRRNLDPFQQHSDADLWNALDEVQLQGTIHHLEGRLDATVAESGSNFSIGQRQLLCLARAILMKTKILILDEATASVDQETDLTIQETLRKKFRDCTVITIAHRLKTVMDYDRVMVMDRGRVREFDQPHLLLENKNSFLSRLVRHSGNEAKIFCDIAEDAYKQRCSDDYEWNVPDHIRSFLSSHIPSNQTPYSLQIVTSL